MDSRQSRYKVIHNRKTLTYRQRARTTSCLADSYQNRQHNTRPAGVCICFRRVLAWGAWGALGSGVVGGGGVRHARSALSCWRCGAESVKAEKAAQPAKNKTLRFFLGFGADKPVHTLLKSFGISLMIGSPHWERRLGPGRLMYMYSRHCMSLG